jgi:hypothetical protein
MSSFKGRERLARRINKSRRKSYTDAVKEYVMPHAKDETTDAIDRVCAEAGDLKDDFVSAAARQILERSEW